MTGRHGTANYSIRSAADATRELVRIGLGERETLSELVSRLLNMAKITFTDAVQREGVTHSYGQIHPPKNLQKHLGRYKGVADCLTEGSLPKFSYMVWDGP